MGTILHNFLEEDDIINKILELPHEWILLRDETPRDLTQFLRNLEKIKTIVESSSENFPEIEQNLYNLQKLIEFNDLLINIIKKHIFESCILRAKRGKILRISTLSSSPSIKDVEVTMQRLKRINLYIVEELLPANFVKFNNIHQTFDKSLWEISISRLSGGESIEILEYFYDFANNVIDSMQKSSFTTLLDIKFIEPEEKKRIFADIENLLPESEIVANEEDKFLNKVYLNHFFDELNDRFKKHGNAINSFIKSNSPHFKPNNIMIKHEKSKFGENELLFDPDNNGRKDLKYERLPVPLRFKENQIGSQYYEAILSELYSSYGYKFLSMTKDEFVYFFEGSNKKPKEYNPPYYWGGEESEMKALLRILYTSATGDSNPSRSFGKLILMPNDKENCKFYHNWGKGKHNLGVSRLTSIEKVLQDIVKNVTGKDLSRIDLNRKYESVHEERDKTIKKSNMKKDKKDEEAES